MTVTGKVARLGHVGIAVADLDRSVDFYSNVLGMRVTEIFRYDESTAGHGVAVLSGAFVRGDKDTIHHRLSIFTLRNPAAKVPGAQTLGLHHIAFEFDTREDLLMLYKRFKDEEIPIVNARIGGPGNHTRFYGLDPDGNVLEFYWNIDQIGWDDRAHVYPPIQVVELDDFDFDEYQRLRETLDDPAWASLDASTLRASAKDAAPEPIPTN
ncbi:VOC family protein [Georgenia ruanii]|uniref:VOC family protein n=1 Tax=Georgenia ruanii TaxID=348442 RepID=A0A7J9UXJ9_9MICO|nr:VOC family protein [Georgenia ruanii]MPV89351.1 VOC family protein [Georgenia ruanii]